MKVTKPQPTIIDITHIFIYVPVRYEEEDIPNNFPLRIGDVWAARVNIDTGKIDGWPQGKSGNLHMKVCDEGSYRLIDKYNGLVASIEQDYVPHGVVPGEGGDYIDLQIDTNGVITNWPKHPDVTAFFRNDEE